MSVGFTATSETIAPTRALLLLPLLPLSCFASPGYCTSAARSLGRNGVFLGRARPNRKWMGKGGLFNPNAIVVLKTCVKLTIFFWKIHNSVHIFQLGVGKGQLGILFISVGV